MTSPDLAPILVAEDNDQDYEVFTEVAKELGCPRPLRRSVTGEQCVDLLSGPGAINPLVLFLDLNMPGMDGREVLNKLREDKNRGVLPVVVLSTSSNPKDIQACYADGANSYHCKPLEAPRYRELIRNMLQYWISAEVVS